MDRPSPKKEGFFFANKFGFRKRSSYIDDIIIKTKKMEKQQIEDLINQLASLTNAMEELNTTLDSALGNGKEYYGNVVDGLFEIARSINPERWEVKKK